jgi:RNA polymerase sigma factor (sigma-70 family)
MLNESMLASGVQAEFSGAFAEGGLSDPRDYTDEALVIAAQNGAPSALGELLTRHRKLLYRTVRRATATVEEAEDVVQDAMLRACASIGKFRREARFSTWLVRIAANSLLSARRKSRPTQWIYLDDDEALTHQRYSYNLHDLRPTPEQECIGRKLSERVQLEIQKLPPSYRSVLQTRFLDEISIADTSRELGITIAALKSRLRRGRSQLSQALGECGLIDRRSPAQGERP